MDPQLTTQVFEIIQSYPAMSIGSLHALQLSGGGGGDKETQGPKLTKSAAEALLNTFVSRGYLTKSRSVILSSAKAVIADSRRGRYSIGPRGALELETYLKKEYEGNVFTCNRCNKLVLGVSSTALLRHLTLRAKHAVLQTVCPDVASKLCVADY